MDVLEKVKKEMLRRRYSARTIATYLNCVRSFIKANHKDTRKYSKTDVREFLEKLAEKGASGSTINVNLQALKFMLEYALNKRVWIDIRYSKNNRKRLPEILAYDEVKMLFSTIKNEKHLIMVQLLYGAGLRVSELLNLKKMDFVLDQCYGWVRKIPPQL
ncbi:MAG TPA: phage integrase N-terminal SAM-like domain-containing protein [Candidatus Nanoarchaeia archaeon]|nr:phage integrase N-terminal SAM-like domain-containing protein [Candidatus Nanoarchaeia archaeon]